ncbi:UDP-N-acetylmuramoyl-L-alanyl-D-glutamate--2,6-diaminopimelate ligase [Patescibacteria group bacterium]|nr:UDP-N-acetylmuramoyl-L-alanyl-D-glutamate--2,6-diaminopimelate ligase [Patescibacteria group bacterium]MBU4078102.1 UDP-N-acetylmuramoyl-L-alanyl-D-glutamate--2,6-diaminopimelate ligase [Patescibacteria group bacterium]
MIKSLIKKILPRFILNWYYQFFPALGALIYGFPSKKLTVIGITGTNGKSTVVELLTSIFQQAGLSVCSISSIRFQIKDKVWQNKLKMTMPGRMRIQKFLRKAVNQGCEYAVLEVTSEGIKQFRHQGIDFKTAVLTNLTKEHIESHGSFENYKKAKAELFKKADVLIVNLDDKNSDYFLSFNAEKKYGYTLKNEKRDFKVFKPEDIGFNLKLKGEFNVYNALASASVALSENISIQDIRVGLEKVEYISGRLEKVIHKPFSVFVDYAHTPDALENVYKTIKPEQGRMICVLGSCGGGRDKWKRKEFGEISSKYCDEIILTNEDPYNEDPNQIIEDISKHTIKQHKKIIDRKEAIKQAIGLADNNDVVIITGKGSEPWMVVKDNKKIPWDDREIVRENFNRTN